MLKSQKDKTGFMALWLFGVNDEMNDKI